MESGSIKWAKENRVGVYPSNTELVSFTRKYKIPPFILLRLDGINLQLSKEASFLGNGIRKILSKRLYVLSIYERRLWANYGSETAYCTLDID